jgi:hypothetical protein
MGIVFPSPPPEGFEVGAGFSLCGPQPTMLQKMASVAAHELNSAPVIPSVEKRLHSDQRQERVVAASLAVTEGVCGAR